MAVNAAGLAFSLVAIQNDLQYSKDVFLIKKKKRFALHARMENISRLNDMCLYCGIIFIISSCLILWNLFLGFIYSFPLILCGVFTGPALFAVALSYGKFLIKRSWTRHHQRTIGNAIDKL